MIPFEQARGLILDGAMTLGDETVNVEHVVGRVLAVAVSATRALPPFDYSAMDGYAVQSNAFVGPAPWSFEVAGESRAGTEVFGALQTQPSGQVTRIFTGGPIPAGADAVVPQEEVERVGPQATFRRAPRFDQHIRHKGDDLAEAQVALQQGMRLGPAQLGLLTSIEATQVSVARRPRVVILSTGDELRDAGSPNRSGSVVDSNGPVVAALCRQVGAEPTCVRVSDSLDAIRSAIREALTHADVLLTIGGVSVGDHDHVRNALQAEGVPLGFWKVAIKPGKPLAFGTFARADRSPVRVLGLPGNPSAAFVTFLLFAAPLLRALQGDKRPIAPAIPARLTHDVKGSTERLSLMRASFSIDDSGLCATVLPNQASGAVTSLAWADGLVAILGDLPAGSIVPATRLADM